MKTIARSIFFGLTCVVVAIASGAAPPVTVLVADSSGKAAYKGATNATGTFATGALKPGSYVVQFNSKGAPKGKYALVISAGKKKVVANAVSGEKFAGGGVAMKIDVAAGLNITGQVAAEDNSSAPMGSNGKPMVWIPKRIGSNLPARWAESDSAEAREAQTTSSFSTKNIQDKQNLGITPAQRGDPINK